VFQIRVDAFQRERADAADIRDAVQRPVVVADAALPVDARARGEQLLAQLARDGRLGQTVASRHRIVIRRAHRDAEQVEHDQHDEAQAEQPEMGLPGDARQERRSQDGQQRRESGRAQRRVVMRPVRRLPQHQPHGGEPRAEPGQCP